MAWSTPTQAPLNNYENDSKSSPLGMPNGGNEGQKPSTGDFSRMDGGSPSVLGNVDTGPDPFGRNAGRDQDPQEYFRRQETDYRNRTEANKITVGTTDSGRDEYLIDLAKRQYGDNWRAGLALIAGANNLSRNPWGSPIVQPGQTLDAPQLGWYNDEQQGDLAKAGNGIISVNSRGLNAKAEYEDKLAQAQKLALYMSGGPRGGTGVAYGDASLTTGISQVPAGSWGDSQAPLGTRLWNLVDAGVVVAAETVMPVIAKAVSGAAAIPYGLAGGLNTYVGVQQGFEAQLNPSSDNPNIQALKTEFAPVAKDIGTKLSALNNQVETAIGDGPATAVRVAAESAVYIAGIPGSGAVLRTVGAGLRAEAQAATSNALRLAGEGDIAAQTATMLNDARQIGATVRYGDMAVLDVNAAGAVKSFNGTWAVATERGLPAIGVETTPAATSAAAREVALLEPRVISTTPASVVNEAMVAAGNEPAWLANTNVVQQIVPAGTRYNMVVGEGQAQALLRGESRFGGWATTDAVPDQAFARNDLAILPEFKTDVSHVVTVEVRGPQVVNSGFVGPLGNARGGASQVEFIAGRNLQLVGDPRALPVVSRPFVGQGVGGGNNGVRFTGAGTTKYDIASESAYADIRALHMTDVEAFAKNSGLTVSEATTLKKQLFFGRHEYPIDGSTVVRQRFAADHEIAFAWKTASEREINAGQQAWIRQLANHELAERSFMAQGIPYRRPEAWNGSSFGTNPPGAHNLAPKPPNTTFPGYNIPSYLAD